MKYVISCEEAVSVKYWVTVTYIFIHKNGPSVQSLPSETKEQHCSSLLDYNLPSKGAFAPLSMTDEAGLAPPLWSFRDLQPKTRDRETARRPVIMSEVNCGLFYPIWFKMQWLIYLRSGRPIFKIVHPKSYTLYSACFYHYKKV